MCLSCVKKCSSKNSINIFPITNGQPKQFRMWSFQWISWWMYTLKIDSVVFFVFMTRLWKFISHNKKKQMISVQEWIEFFGIRARRLIGTHHFIIIPLYQTWNVAVNSTHICIYAVSYRIYIVYKTFIIIIKHSVNLKISNETLHGF